MFAGLLRRSEAGGILIERMRWAQAGVELWIPRLKNAPAGEGVVKRIPRIRVPAIGKDGRPYVASATLCPVAAIEDWLRASRLRDGPLFPGRTLTRVWATEGLSGSQVARIVKVRCEAAGVDIDREEMPAGQVKVSRLRSSGHSLRRGAATAADQADVGLVQLMNAGGWKDVRSTARYVDEADAFEETLAVRVLGGECDVR